MSTRVDRYFNEERVKSRYEKNEELYREISKSELDNYEIKSNSAILGENNNSIDVEKIKKILDTRYNDVPKRRSIRLEEREEKEVEEKEITKEYDINVILEKAKEQKTDKYEEERLKKIRDTQFDILKNLHLETNEKEEEKPSDNLEDLINTIAINESHSKKLNNTSLDILSDLRGDEDTEVLEGLKDDVEKVLDSELEEDTEEKEIEEKEEEKNETKMVNSFYTSSNAINQKDFEDIDDFSKSIESNNTFIKVIIGIIIVILLVGIIIFIKSIYFS